MRAIILCAGMGTRLYPFTTKKHKAFLPIKGKPLIESTINYLHSHNITDITIVVGYCAEQFNYLIDKYNVELRVSTLYQTHNNYTSMQLVLDKLEDALVLEGDVFLIDDFIPRIDTTKDQYLSQKITRGQEWGLTLDKNNRILDVVSNATNGWGLIGIFYWTGKLTSLLKTELSKCTQNEYWDNALWRLINQYPIYANCVDQEIAMEFDKIEDILFHKAMSYEEIALWCSDDDKYTKIDEYNYKVMQNNKQYMIQFTENSALFLEDENK